jgi:hypothetical protein
MIEIISRSICNFTLYSASPKKDTDFWQQWHGFEVEYGNEDTFREMLRLRRSVAAQFASETYMQVGFVLMFRFVLFHVCKCVSHLLHLHD